MEFEDILVQVGGYGKYQKILTIVFVAPVACVIALTSMSVLFMVSIPEHWCRVSDVTNSNLSFSEQRTLISPPADPSCSMYDVNYTEYLHSDSTIPNDTETVPCQNGWQYDETDYTSTASTDWNLVCDRRYFPSLIITLQNAGSLLLNPLYGFLADRYGRKRVYLFLALLSSVSEFASLAVENFIAFLVFRILRGSVVPSIFTLGFILITEIVTPENRAHMNGVMNIFWIIGLCILPLVGYLSKNWINLGVVCGVLCAGNIFYIWFVPESPCWLISKRRYEEATTIMEQIGQKNGKPQDRVHLFRQLQTLGLRDEKKKEKEKTRVSVNLLLKYPRIRRHFIILLICWGSFYVTYFGILYNMRNLSGNEFLNFFLLSVAEIPGNILFWILMDRAGRRWTASIGYIIVGLVCLGPLSGFEYSDTIFSIIAKFISTGLYMVTDQNGAELFPTVARSFCVNFGKTLAYAPTLVMPFLADIGEQSKDFPFIIMCVISLITGVLASFLPETLNENLPQTISDAEEFGKDQKFFSWKRSKGNTVSQCRPGVEK